MVLGVEDKILQMGHEMLGISLDNSIGLCSDNDGGRFPSKVERAIRCHGAKTSKGQQHPCEAACAVGPRRRMGCLDVEVARVHPLCSQ